MLEKLAFLSAGSLSGYLIGKNLDQRWLKEKYLGESTKKFEEVTKKMEIKNPYLKEIKQDFHLMNDLHNSKMYLDKVRKQLYFIYNPRFTSQGHEGIVHGGFTFGMTRAMANLFVEKFGLGADFKNSYVRYKRPSFVNQIYFGKTFVDLDGNIVTEIKDKDDQLVVTSVRRYDHVYERPWIKDGLQR